MFWFKHPSSFQIVQKFYELSNQFWNQPEFFEIIQKYPNSCETIQKCFQTSGQFWLFFCISRKYSGDFETIENVHKTSSPDSFETIEKVYKKTSSPDSFENIHKIQFPVRKQFFHV